jgi:hypothetical protein
MAGMWDWLAGALAVVFLVGVYFVGLCTLMVGAWCAGDRYLNGTQKDRRVIGFGVLVVAVLLWALTTSHR